MSRLAVNVELLRGARTLQLEARCEAFPLALLGPSGSGKTSLLECVAGLVAPMRGWVRWKTRSFVDVARGVNLAPEHRRVGYVMQEGVLFPHLSVRDNVAFSMRRTTPSRGRRERADALLDELGVLPLAARKPDAISGGERARVALARALASAPDLVLLDEPFTGLDPITRDHTQRMLLRVLERHDTPAVWVTHERNDALQYAATTWVLFDGRIVQEGSPDDIVRRPASPEVANFVGIENLAAGETVASPTAGLCQVRCAGALFTVRGEFEPRTPVYVCVRPEDLVLTHDDAPSSARNRIRMRVVRLTTRGVWRRVELEARDDASLRMDALVTRAAEDELGIVPGLEVGAQFKASAAHLLSRTQPRSTDNVAPQGRS